MDIGLHQNISYESISYPRKNKRHNDGKVSSWSTIDFDYHGNKNHIIGIHCLEMICVMVYEGSYDEPPYYEPEVIGELKIQPVLKYWGKGI